MTYVFSVTTISVTCLSVKQHQVLDWYLLCGETVAFCRDVR